MIKLIMIKGEFMNKKKNFLLILIIIMLVILIVAAGLYVVIKNINENNANGEYSKTASSYASGITESAKGTSPSINANDAKNPIDFKALSKKNSDIYSWIYIPDTNINYPVCQSADNDDFYLDHDMDKNYSYSGTIYSQICNSRDYSDRVTVLYGHNMANGSMFANLHKFESSDFFNKHKNIYVYTQGHKLTYTVVSAYVYDDRHITNSFDFSKDSDFNEYIDSVINPRSVSKNVREGIHLTTDDKLLTLSTCLNSGDGRYLVQGVLQKDEHTK